MAYTGEITLVASNLITTAVTTPYAALSNMDVYREGTFVMAVSASSGTYTLNAYIQSWFNGYWCDIASFAQVAVNGNRVLRGVGSVTGPGISSTMEEAVTDGTLTAGTVRAGPWGTQIRGKIITTGSGFSVTVAIVGEVKG